MTLKNTRWCHQYRSGFFLKSDALFLLERLMLSAETPRYIWLCSPIEDNVVAAYGWSLATWWFFQRKVASSSWAQTRDSELIFLSTLATRPPPLCTRIQHFYFRPSPKKLPTYFYQHWLLLPSTYTVEFIYHSLKFTFQTLQCHLQIIMPQPLNSFH